jgi:hypothetical protein
MCNFSMIPKPFLTEFMMIVVEFAKLREWAAQ